MQQLPPQVSGELLPPSLELRQAVDIVCDRDRAFKRVEAEAGALTAYRWKPGFASLVRIIIGQQLSAKAARSIFLRLTEAIDLTPAQFVLCPETVLKQVGLSQAKIATCQRLAAAIESEQLNLESLHHLPDALVIEHLTQFKGIGMWTAEIYLLFCLERLSAFPASDLAIQIAYQQLKTLEKRPTRLELLGLTKPLDPYGGALAHLLWHYYRFAVR